MGIPLRAQGSGSAWSGKRRTPNERINYRSHPGCEFRPQSPAISGERTTVIPARDLQESKEKVIEIAGKYGYESVDAFTKAFFRQHGMAHRAIIFQLHDKLQFILRLRQKRAKRSRFASAPFFAYLRFKEGHRYGAGAGVGADHTADHGIRQILTIILPQFAAVHDIFL